MKGDIAGGALSEGTIQHEFDTQGTRTALGRAGEVETELKALGAVLPPFGRFGRLPDPKDPGRVCVEHGFGPPEGPQGVPSAPGRSTEAENPSARDAGDRDAGVTPEGAETLMGMGGAGSGHAGGNVEGAGGWIQCGVHGCVPAGGGGASQGGQIGDKPDQSEVWHAWRPSSQRSRPSVPRRGRGQECPRAQATGHPGRSSSPRVPRLALGRFKAGHHQLTRHPMSPGLPGVLREGAERGSRRYFGP